MVSRLPPKALSSANLASGAQVALYSDSPELAKTLLEEVIGKVNVSLPPSTDDALSILSCMSNHNLLISSPSTFSWWAIFLQSQQGDLAVMPSEIREAALGVVPETKLLTRATFV